MAWNGARTDAITSIVAGVQQIPGGAGDTIHPYVARPEGPARSQALC